MARFVMGDLIYDTEKSEKVCTYTKSYPNALKIYGMTTYSRKETDLYKTAGGRWFCVCKCDYNELKPYTVTEREAKETLKKINAIELYSKHYSGIRLAGTLVTNYRNNDANVAGVEWLHANGYKVFNSRIRHSDKATESIFFHQPAQVYSPRSAAAIDYKVFMREYLGQKGGRSYGTAKKV